ncbi:Mpo1-like protein [Ideonella margarita]|uniref:Mpo1-like protein n=1 Tax=Ideonella margarita TaxID=2984191 RepID=A0ABU9C433_9BURK
MLDSFMKELREQRWDDHRYYHHSRINQTLHFISAISFMVAYALLFVDPAWSALLAWLVSMTTRQAGHFFFEPLGYDEVNQATQEHKEAIKVGYNLRRKVVLMGLWAGAPLLVWLQPTLFGLLPAWTQPSEYAHHVGYVWFWLGVAGLLFRTVHLFFIRGVQTGLAWMCKILTDPFNDFLQYRDAPLALLRGELIDPMTHVHQPRH